MAVTYAIMIAGFLNKKEKTYSNEVSIASHIAFMYGIQLANRHFYCISMLYIFYRFFLF